MKIWRPENPTQGWLQAMEDSKNQDRCQVTLYIPMPDKKDECVPIFFRRIPAGEFRMGSRGYYPDEEPVTLVRIEHDFYMGTFPVTQVQYRAMATQCQTELEKIEGHLGPDPSYFKGDDRPVEKVNWYEARVVAGWITKHLQETSQLPDKLAGYQAHLPSEVQWEYACRAGTEADYWSGDGEAALGEVGWYAGPADWRTHRVGEKGGANPWGLHDMHGNVNEWCHDIYNPSRGSLLLPGDVGVVFEDEANVKREKPNAAIVEGKRFFEQRSKGQGNISETDMQLLNWWISFATRQAHAKAEGWDAALNTLQQSKKSGAWPAAGVTLADDLARFCQGFIEATEGVARLLRGGSWIYSPWDCRSALRGRLGPGDRDWDFGFRLALVPGPSSQVQASWPEAPEHAERAADGVGGAGGKPRRDAASVPEAADAVSLEDAAFPPLPPAER